MPRTRRAFIIDDHALMAEALAIGLSAHGFECAIAAQTGVSEICAQAFEFAPGLVLLDLNLNGLDGLDLVGPLARTKAKVLVVSASNQEERLGAALALGAVGWISKNERFERLLSAAIDSLAGKAIMAPDRYAALSELGRKRLVRQRELRGRFGRLTTREREVLLALSTGRTVSDIAKQLYLSVPTVRSHVRGVLSKLEVSNQLAAVAVASELDLAD